MDVIGPKIEELGADRVARWTADAYGTSHETEARRLHAYRSGATTTMDVERADALILAVTGDYTILLGIEHWPSSLAAAKEMVEAEAWVKGVTLDRQESERMARDLYILAKHVFEKAASDSPAAMRVREQGRKRQERKKTTKQELIAA